MLESMTELSLPQWITMVGAAVAAIAGCWNLWLSFIKNSDQIEVRCSGYSPIATPATEMYVVNSGEHTVQISDYGFINSNGSLFSIPWYHETADAYMDGEDPHGYRQGSTNIAPHELFAIGMTYNDEVIGAYARTVRHRIPRVDMRKSRIRPQTFYYWLKAKFLQRYR